MSLFASRDTQSSHLQMISIFTNIICNKIGTILIVGIAAKDIVLCGWPWDELDRYHLVLVLTEEN